MTSTNEGRESADSNSLLTEETEKQMEVENIEDSLQHLQLTSYADFEHQYNIANKDVDENEEEAIINDFLETGNNK